VKNSKGRWLDDARSKSWEATSEGNGQIKRHPATRRILTVCTCSSRKRQRCRRRRGPQTSKQRASKRNHGRQTTVEFRISTTKIARRRPFDMAEELKWAARSALLNGWSRPRFDGRGLAAGRTNGPAVPFPRVRCANQIEDRTRSARRAKECGLRIQSVRNRYRRYVSARISRRSIVRFGR